MERRDLFARPPTQDSIRRFPRVGHDPLGMPQEGADRAHQRYDLKLQVEIRHDDRTFRGESVNVSLGGILIRCLEPVPFGALVFLRFRIPALKEDAAVEAIDRWTTHGAIGVEFVGLRAIEVWGLNKLFEGARPDERVRLHQPRAPIRGTPGA
jgi:hypothetical protein